MIAPKCDRCGKELMEPGALAFSPPRSYPPLNYVQKYHLCVECWDEVTAGLFRRDVDPLSDLPVYRTPLRPTSEIPEMLRDIVPSIGSVWEWEPLNPRARETVTVVGIEWNGHEVWIESEMEGGRRRYKNTLDRWIEATVFVRAAPGEG